MSTTILVTAIHIISVFQVPLGNPIYQKAIYPNPEVCQQYKAQFDAGFATGPQKISLEHNAYGQSKCFSPEEFEKTFGFSPFPPRE